MAGAVAVTGASGKLGRRIAARLAEAGVDQLLVSRDPARLPDLPRAERRGPAAYGDTAAMRRALEGASTLVLVSGNLSGRRLEEHASAIDAARAAGVERILYVSLLGAAPDATYLNARDHWQTERYLAEADVRSVVLRPGLYAAMLPGLAVDGVLRGPSGDGRVSLVTHHDIAEVAAAVVVDHPGVGLDVADVLEVTGPEALTLDEATARIAAVTGRPLRFEHETPEDGFAWRSRREDATGARVDGWISWHLAIARGQVETVTDVVERFTGHPARPVEDAHR